MAEEQRHGWQMAYLLVTYFGKQGAREAQKLLERNAQDGSRLLGAFNRPMPHWLDFFCYTMFVDRDGKFQLGMLSTSGFKPLAASMGPMLKEESFHLGTGSNGLRRIIKAGVIHLDMLQRYINKWASTAHDLFGNDSSSSANWAYVWGIKGRWDERKKTEEGILVDKEVLNENHVVIITMRSSGRSPKSTDTCQKAPPHSTSLMRTSTVRSVARQASDSPSRAHPSKAMTKHGQPTLPPTCPLLRMRPIWSDTSSRLGSRTEHHSAYDRVRYRCPRLRDRHDSRCPVRTG